ncbi:MAG: hypothetical protein SPC28_00925 [Alloprevotella sp.]|nr:hypothetical protein [Alloprevotella sp.]
MMKHLKQLLLLLCVMASSMCGNLSAQTFTASPAPVDGKFVAGTKWYTIKNVTTAGTGYLATSGTNYVDNDGQLLLANATAPTTDAGYWCVVQSDENYVFYNRAAGANKVLGIYYNPSAVQVEGKNSYAKMYDAGTTETNIVKAFAKGTNTTSANSKSGNFFYLPGNTDAYLNKHGQNNPYRLAIWENGNASNDDGSCFTFTHVMDEPAKITDDVRLSNAPVGGVFDPNTHWYTMKTGSNFYLKGDATVTNGYITLANTSEAPNNDAGYWCVVGNETDGYTFYNRQGKKLVMYGSTAKEGSNSYAVMKEADYSEGTDETSKFDFTKSKKSGKYWCFKQHGSTNLYATRHGAVDNRLAYWNSMQAVNGWNAGDNGDEGSCFIFEEVSVGDDVVQVTLHYDAGNGYTFDVAKNLHNGETLQLSQVEGVDFYTDFAITTADKTIAADKVFDISCTPNFPFTEGHVYKMYGNEHNTTCFSYDDPTNNRATYMASKTKVDINSYWTFEHISGTQNKFYVYNLGAKKYLSFKDARDYAKFETMDESTEGYSKIVRITPNSDGFNLQHETGYACCSTHMGGGVSGETNSMASWGNGLAEAPSKDASRVYIYDIKSELAALGNDPVMEGTYVGETTSPRLISTAAAAGATPTKANVVACLDAYNNPKLADYVTANKYYQIFFEGSDGTNQALALNAATETYSDGAFTLVPGTVMAVAESGIGQTDNIASIYQFTKGTSGMLVTNVNAQAAWGTVSASGLEGTTGTGTEYPFAVASGKSNNSYWNIVTGTGHLVLDGTAVRNSTSAAAVARLKEVTSIPVTIKNTLWTSLCFPVDVVIPANLKAYKAASTQGMTINLEELAEGSRIPAGTGFLALAEAGGNYSFAIATGSEPEADVSGNQFTGAKVKRSGMADVDYFALATKNEVTGFYKVGTGTVPANKAYLLAEKLNQGAGANMLQFAFGEGTETGISNVNAENSGKAETYYDLNGRLVVYPTRGVYVTGSGRKVFVK